MGVKSAIAARTSSGAFYQTIIHTGGTIVEFPASTEVSYAGWDATCLASPETVMVIVSHFTYLLKNHLQGYITACLSGFRPAGNATIYYLRFLIKTYEFYKNRMIFNQSILIQTLLLLIDLSFGII